LAAPLFAIFPLFIFPLVKPTHAQYEPFEAAVLRGVAKPNKLTAAAMARTHQPELGLCTNLTFSCRKSQQHNREVHGTTPNLPHPPTPATIGNNADVAASTNSVVWISTCCVNREF
jgi:hypothetical protein